MARIYNTLTTSGHNWCHQHEGVMGGTTMVENKTQGNWPHTGNCWACEHWHSPPKRAEHGAHGEVLYMYGEDIPSECVNLHQLAKYGERRSTGPMDRCDQYETLNMISKKLGA